MRRLIVPVLLIRHAVTNFDAWRKVFQEDKVVRRAAGAQNEFVFRSAIDSNEVWLVLQWDDLFRARLFAISDDLVDTLTRAGVMVQPEIWYLDDVDEFPKTPWRSW
jgi:hypothetical protein